MSILEKEIAQIIEKQIDDGIFNNIISEALNKAVQNATNEIFSSWNGVGTKIIKNKLQEILIPMLEKYDFDRHCIKLDAVLTEIINSNPIQTNKQILENFKYLMSNDNIISENKITISQLFEIYGQYLQENLDRDSLEINEDDQEYYEDVPINVEVTYDDTPCWSSFEYGKIIFSCDIDEEDNSFMINISRYNKDANWSMDFKTPATFSSIRYLNDFELFLIKLTQQDIKLVIDKDYLEEELIIGRDC